MFFHVKAENSKLRVLYILRDYPVISETYMHEELASVWDDYDIKIVTISKGNWLKRKNHFPYEYVGAENLGKVIEEFKPDIMHSHWALNLPLLKKLAETYHIPYTVRTHSFDILVFLGSRLKTFCEAANSDWCLRVLCFPFAKEMLIEHGMQEEKIACCWPVVGFSRFYNPNPKTTTQRVFQTNAGLAKHGNKRFIGLAAMMKDSGFEFNLYVRTDQRVGGVRFGDILKTYNQEKGNPVTNITYVDPEDMPSIYQSHDWLICASDPNINTVGLPVAIGEAQASGIGVCWRELPNRREDQLEYLGGAGFLFQSIDELPAILSQPYPESMRLAGLENAKKCDIENHKQLLTQVWDSVLP